MKIKVDYDAHPDCGGVQKIYNAETGIEIESSQLIGKTIKAINVEHDELHFILEENL
jgi:hypothetical protein